MKGVKKMTGSLQIKGNTYYAVLNLYDENGKRKPKWISTKLSVDGNNKRRAEKALRDILKGYEDKKVDYSGDIDFADWIKDWLDRQKNNIELTTWEGYESYVKVHIIPYYMRNKVTLSEIEPRHIQDYYKEKLLHGRVDGKGGLSANSIKKHNAVLNGALKDALKQNLIPYNPADRATLPKAESKFIGSYYNIQQAEKLLKYSAGTTLETVIILTLYYGLRRSEVCGLKWSAIDFNNDTLTVKNTVVRVKTLVEKERTKNKTSCRTLPLLANVKEHLKSLKVKQLELQFLHGKAYSRNDYVCRWDDGRAFSPNFITRKFGKIVKSAGLPQIRFHDLRHTCATLLLSMGFSLKEIQEWLGHGDLSTTANIYAHLDYSAKVNIADKLSNAIKLTLP